MKARINGKTVGPWTVVEEVMRKRRRCFVRRWTVDHTGRGRNERLPTEQYAHLLDDRAELDAFVRRLNAAIFREQAAIEAILDRSAFLNQQMLERYRAHLDAHVPNPVKVEEMLSTLKKHVLGVFVGRWNVINPKDWVEYEDRWYKYLLEDPEVPKAASTKKRIIQYLNRFVRWLHKVRRDEIPLYVFDGPGFHKMAAVERTRKKKERRYIPDGDWQTIERSLPDDIRPWILLCYDYGLRRKESLGLAYRGTDAVKANYLKVEKQLLRFDPKKGTKEFAPLKTQGRQSVTNKPVEYREVHHWLGATPNRAYDLIEEAMPRLMHPTSLTKRWREYMISLGMTYDIHDLRHTWITRARAKYPPRDVQLGAGHASSETTERYSHDHREHDDKPFKPKKSA